MERKKKILLNRMVVLSNQARQLQNIGRNIEKLASRILEDIYYDDKEDDVNGTNGKKNKRIPIRKRTRQVRK